MEVAPVPGHRHRAAPDPAGPPDAAAAAAEGAVGGMLATTVPEASIRASTIGESIEVR